MRCNLDLARRSTYGLLGVVAAVLLCACGGGGDGGSAATAVAARPDTAASSASAGAVSALASENPVVVVVGSTSVDYPGATHYAQLVDVPWSSLAPGSSVKVAPGSYSGPVAISAVGSAGAPITVDAIDQAHLPVLTDGVDFQQSSWVQVSHLSVQAPTYAGFVIRRGSHHVTVADSLVSRAPLGINITDGAGTGIALLRNRIEDSATDGLGVDGVNADPADRSLIQNNTVLRSGHHGIEIRGSNYQVERNDVSLSGQSVSGTSGIHIFSNAEGDGTGSGNLVRYNLSHQNSDVQASDGNGIEVDRFCDGNTVAFNVLWGNDGAGIAIYDGNGNSVYANTLTGNSQDPGARHGSLGQIVLNSSQVGASRPANNRIYDNLLVSTRAAVPALYVDTNAVAVGSNETAPNLLYNTAGGTVLRWTDSQFLSTLPDIDHATGSTDNLLTYPAFADASQPQADGLRLTASPGTGSVDLSGQVDRLAQTWAAGDIGFGAYFIGP